MENKNKKEKKSEKFKLCIKALIPTIIELLPQIRILSTSMIVRKMHGHSHIQANTTFSTWRNQFTHFFTLNSSMDFRIISFWLGFFIEFATFPFFFSFFFFYHCTFSSFQIEWPIPFITKWSQFNAFVFLILSSHREHRPNRIANIHETATANEREDPAP